MDRISLKRLRVRTSIGVPEEERRLPQELSVSLDVLHPLRATAKEDGLSSGIDYACLVEAVQILAKVERNTIERFAEDIAEMVLRTFKPAGGVTVTVCKKPSLPIDEACVTVVRP